VGGFRSVLIETRKVEMGTASVDVGCEVMVEWPRWRCGRVGAVSCGNNCTRCSVYVKYVKCEEELAADDADGLDAET